MGDSPGMAMWRHIPCAIAVIVSYAVFVSASSDISSSSVLVIREDGQGESTGDQYNLQSTTAGPSHMSNEASNDTHQ